MNSAVAAPDNDDDDSDCESEIDRPLYEATREAGTISGRIEPDSESSVYSSLDRFGIGTTSPQTMEVD